MYNRPLCLSQIALYYDECYYSAERAGAICGRESGMQAPELLRCQNGELLDVEAVILNHVGGREQLKVAIVDHMPAVSLCQIKMFLPR
jgi:hypothetical protein